MVHQKSEKLPPLLNFPGTLSWTLKKALTSLKRLKSKPKTWTSLRPLYNSYGIHPASTDLYLSTRSQLWKTGPRYVAQIGIELTLRGRTLRETQYWSFRMATATCGFGSRFKNYSECL